MPTDMNTLINDIAHAERIPDAALGKLMAHVAALAPRIEALARRRIEGGWLYPSEDNLLFYGLFVLAASRERSFWPTWLELARQPEDILQCLFGDGAVQSVAAITLGLTEDDADKIGELIESPDLCDDARAGFVAALARLMCEERFPRSRFIDLIDKLAVMEGTANDGHCKWCVEDAIVLGGIAERMDLLEQLWTTDAFSVWRDIDKSDARERIQAAAANPSELSRFDEDGIAAPRHPIDGLRWLKRIEEHGPDPTDEVALTWREREWLASFLQGGAMPADTMSFEEFDGFFHALVIGPDLIMPSEYLPEIWGDGPEFEDAAQLRKVMELLQRHWNAIAVSSNATF